MGAPVMMSRAPGKVRFMVWVARLTTVAPPLAPVGLTSQPSSWLLTAKYPAESLLKSRT